MKSTSSSKQDTRPKYHGAKMAAPKTTVIKKRFLVFNSSLSGNDPHKMVAILRIWNPTPNSDVFYKLTPDSHKASFHVKAWKGRVRKNNHIDVSIWVKVASSEAELSGHSSSSALDNQASMLSLAQLCQVGFQLEMTEYTSRWRPNSANCSLVVKVELHCVTREILNKLQNEAMLNIEDAAVSSEHIRCFIAKCAQEKPIYSAHSCRNAYLTCGEITEYESPPASLESEQGALEESGHSSLEQVTTAELNEDDISQEDATKSETPTPKNEAPVDSKQHIVPTFIMLLMLLLDLVLQMFTATMGYSKQLAHKLTRQVWHKKVTVKSEQALD